MDRGDDRRHVDTRRRLGAGLVGTVASGGRVARRCRSNFSNIIPNSTCALPISQMQRTREQPRCRAGVGLTSAASTKAIISMDLWLIPSPVACLVATIANRHLPAPRASRRPALSTSLTVAVLRAQRSISLFSGVPAGSLGLPGSSQQNLFQGGRGVSAEVPAAASVPTSPEPDEPGAAHQMTESALRRFELESSSTWCTSSRNTWPSTNWGTCSPPLGRPRTRASRAAERKAGSIEAIP